MWTKCPVSANFYRIVLDLLGLFWSLHKISVCPTSSNSAFPTQISSGSQSSAISTNPTHSFNVPTPNHLSSLVSEKHQSSLLISLYWIGSGVLFWPAVLSRSPYIKHSVSHICVSSATHITFINWNKFQCWLTLTSFKQSNQSISVERIGTSQIDSAMDYDQHTVCEKIINEIDAVFHKDPDL